MSRVDIWFAETFKTAQTEDEYRAFVEPPNMAWTCTDLCSLFMKHHPFLEPDMIKPCMDQLINQVFLQRKLTRIRRFKKLLLPIFRIPGEESAFKADQDSQDRKDAPQASKDQKDSLQPFLLVQKRSKALKAHHGDKIAQDIPPDLTVPKSRPSRVIDGDTGHEGKSDSLSSSRRRTRSASSAMPQDHQRRESKKSKKSLSKEGSFDSRILSKEGSSERKMPEEQVENSPILKPVVARKRGRPRKHPVVVDEE